MEVASETIVKNPALIKMLGHMIAATPKEDTEGLLRCASAFTKLVGLSPRAVLLLKCYFDQESQDRKQLKAAAKKAAKPR